MLFFWDMTLNIRVINVVILFLSIFMFLVMLVFGNIRCFPPYHPFKSHHLHLFLQTPIFFLFLDDFNTGDDASNNTDSSSPIPNNLPPMDPQSSISII